MQPFARWPVLAIAAAEVLVLLIGAGGYGYHRDELYFIEAGNHPAFGYDDQPPLTPLIGWASAALFGETPTGPRVAPALALAAAVVLAALTARELGGGTRAQVLAAASLAASSAMFLGHLLSTATFDFLAWAVVVFLFLRLLRGGGSGTWVATGVATGIALQNKWLILMLVGSLAVGVVAARRWDLLRGPWPWIAAAIALAIWAPNLIWQADHGWPQRELSGQIADEDPLGARLMFLPFQILIVSPLLAPFWIAGVPRAYSGHNSFASFGMPPGRAGPVIAVGIPEGSLGDFDRCRLAGRIDNGVGVDNEEQEAPISVCAAPRRPWARLWPLLHHLDA